MPLLVNDDVTHRSLPARRAAGGAVPQRRRRRGPLRPPGPRHAVDHVRRAAVQAVRLRRHSALHDLSPRLRCRTCSRICSSIEAANNVVIPPRYLNPDGQLRLGAPFSERDLHGPREPLVIDREEDATVLIKDGTRLTRYTLAQHPFDVVGWDGMVYPFTFNADDFEPITGTIHQPPPMHQTFEATGFVLCTFAPRLLDTHPEAIKVPYAHSNVQADEVLYYVRGQFGSRRGVEEASFTLHPRGIPHGPHPGTIVASRPMTRTDELAVMVDTVQPLRLTRQAMEMDDPNYPYSWLD